MTPQKVMIGLPSYDGWSDKFAISLISALQKAPCQLNLFSLNGDSLIPRARNNLAAEFLASDADHLLFLDVDLEFEAEGLHRLLSHDLPVVGGVYLQKRYDKIIPVFNRIVGEEVGKDGLLKVKHVGTGYMLIAREVFETLDETGMVERYHTNANEATQRWQHNYFPIGVGPDARYESEDWAFCRLAQEAGFDCWVDTRVVAAHHGHGKYPNDAVDQMRHKLSCVETEVKEMSEATTPEEMQRHLATIMEILGEPLLEKDRL